MSRKNSSFMISDVAKIDTKAQRKTISKEAQFFALHEVSIKPFGSRYHLALVSC